MEGTVQLPKWFKDYEPIHPITADCVLEWPDEKNCNEFPVLCPVHGILSRWCLKSDRCTCFDQSKANETPAVQQSEASAHRSIKSVNDALRLLWGGESVPCLFKTLNSGTPADSLENRRAMFNGSQLSLTPRGPVIVNSHSLHALDDSSRRKPKVNVDKLNLGPVYAYLRDLGLFSEWCAVFKSQLRHAVPNDVNFEQKYKQIVVYRKYRLSGLIVNVFPVLKCFVAYIDYQHFEIRPDLHYGDQIMEFGHCVLQSDRDSLSRNPQAHDVFYLRVRPCPFLKWLTLSVGNCPIATDSSHFRGKRSGHRSHRDLGFSLNNGCVTAVAINSPAMEAGMQPDHHIVEIGGVFVAFHRDHEMVSMMRQRISDSCTRSVEIAVIPERIHQQLISVHNPHYVSTNRGFHLKAWVNAEAFGLCAEN